MHKCIALLLLLFGLFNNLKCTQMNGTIPLATFGPKAKLEIEPPYVHGIGHKLIIKKSNESLNLTCTVVQQSGGRNDSLFNYDVDWKVSSASNLSSNFDRGNIKNMAWLWFDRLTERDSGNYTCHALAISKDIVQSYLSVNIYLSVKSLKTKPSFCGSQWFICRSTNCIMKRYVCDGKKDCEEGEDESLDAGCGIDPCNGKIFCGERCIPPEWCCDYRNCSTTYGLRPWPPETHEISYVQTAIYTVIGCAMAFMFIVTILVIAICRIHIKRAMNTRWNQRNREICRRPPRSVSLNMPIYDVDVYLNRTADNYLPGVNIMYNINSGVQFVGQPVEPPPYSEVMATPPREGPPPPYVSCENLTDRSATQRMLTNSSNNCDADALPAIQNIESSYNAEIPCDYYSIRTILDIPDTQVPSGSHSTAISTHNEPDINLRSNGVQMFDLEYVETDALLSESSRNNKITNSKEWKSGCRHSIVKNKLLSREYSDKAGDKSRFNRSTDENPSNSPLVRRKEFSLGDIENEGIFLETDQQDSSSESTVFSSQTDPVCSSLLRGIGNSEAGPSSSNNKASEEKPIDDKLINKESNTENKLYSSVTVADNARYNKNVSTYPSQVQNSENIMHGNTVICDNDLTNVSSINMSTSVVSSDDVQDDVDDSDANNELQASGPLILPLRESFIGVQRGN